MSHEKTFLEKLPYADVNEAKIKSCQNDIIIKGQLNEDTMRMLYKQFLRSRSLSIVELSDIHNSYKNAGILGLKKPKPLKK